MKKIYLLCSLLSILYMASQASTNDTKWYADAQCNATCFPMCESALGKPLSCSQDGSKSVGFGFADSKEDAVKKAQNDCYDKALTKLSSIYSNNKKGYNVKDDRNVACNYEDNIPPIEVGAHALNGPADHWICGKRGGVPAIGATKDDAEKAVNARNPGNNAVPSCQRMSIM